MAWIYICMYNIHHKASASPRGSDGQASACNVGDPDSIPGLGGSLGEGNSYQRIDAFELWCWRRLLRVPWTAGRSNRSILKEISPEYSLEGLMLNLKLQYFSHLI